MKTSPRSEYTQPLMVAVFQLSSLECQPRRSSISNATNALPALSRCGVLSSTRTRRSEGDSLERENLLRWPSFAASGASTCASTSDTAVGALSDSAKARLDVRAMVVTMKR